jgi:hypothetical protein
MNENENRNENKQNTIEDESPASITNYYKNYFCTDCINNGKNLEWRYEELIYTEDLCSSCGLNYNLNQNSVVRWSCNDCNRKYCTKCYPILIKKQCPVDHELILTKKVYQDNVCDVCGNNINTQFFYSDSVCNLLICISCLPNENI